jgi:hypothetical protein
LKTGEQLLEIHDVSRWRGRIVPDRGEPLTGLAVGQRIVVVAAGDPHHRAETTIGEILPPPDRDSEMVLYTGPMVHDGWRSGMTGEARIYAPKRSVAYRLLVLPIARLIDFELPNL